MVLSWLTLQSSSLTVLLKGPFHPWAFAQKGPFAQNILLQSSPGQYLLHLQGGHLLWHMVLNSCPHPMSSRPEACCAIRCATALCAHYSPLSLFQCHSLEQACHSLSASNIQLCTPSLAGLSFYSRCLSQNRNSINVPQKEVNR